MTNLVSVERARVRYADKVILDGVSLGVDDGDRVGVIGRNGSGKSTLLRVLADVQPLDAGRVVHAGRLVTQLVAQEPDLPLDSTALEVVLDADSAPGRIFRRFTTRPTDPRSTVLMDAHGLWDFEHVARAVLDRFDVRADRSVGELSGGERMRVALARGLVHSDVAARTGDAVPLLILDEPTNHLDLTAIEWLEERIGAQRGAVVLVTHDRYLLDRTATRIVEVVGGVLHTEHGSYADYLANRAERAQRAATHEHRRRQRARAELDWLQRSPPARTSKSRARIDRAVQLLEAQPPASEGEVAIDLPARRLGSKVVTLHNAGRRYGDTVVLRGVTANLEPGARIGVVGPNGSGKTTLLELIAGRAEPDEGSVRLGTTVHVGWYGQHTSTPQPRQRVIDAVSEVVLETRTSGGITLSAAGLLERFGFSATAQQAYVTELSGGERRRLELLRVLATAPNLLLLDEPTNDLDLDTLAVLEAFLEQWPGTLVAASHDRFFLDRVCRQLWSIEPDGSIRDHPGGWTAYRTQLHHATVTERPAPPTAADRAETRPARRPGRLSYNEQRELRRLERALPALEERRDAVHTALIDAADDHVRAGDLARDLDELVARIDREETRWLELSLRADPASQEQQ
ncbi:MAG: ABC-F family ATP-binding cassette domain-containing protein [Actinobacteria bacterium]|nr:ABC-F family ATP-binding cassette domain-containing protein [Actinomycetota bacterium]